MGDFPSCGLGIGKQQCTVEKRITDADAQRAAETRVRKREFSSMSLTVSEGCSFLHLSFMTNTPFARIYFS